MDQLVVEVSQDHGLEVSILFIDVYRLWLILNWALFLPFWLLTSDLTAFPA